MSYEKYREHPRIVELKFSYIHTLFSMAYGIEKTHELFKVFCAVSRVNWIIISSTIGRKDNILTLNYTDKPRFRQEVVLMGLAYGDNRVTIGKKYLNLSKRSVYELNNKALDPEVFLTGDWIGKLDYSVQIAGTQAYHNEMLRFIDFIASLKGVI